jgi:high-affinity Fe2+/Pb2+ permease
MMIDQDPLACVKGIINAVFFTLLFAFLLAMAIYWTGVLR